MGFIAKRTKGKNTYYLYQESYREKINEKHSGKNRGSGKSRVCSRTEYLGSAEQILACVKNKRKPYSVKVRKFGLIAAAYQVSKKIDLNIFVRDAFQFPDGFILLLPLSIVWITQPVKTK